MPLEEWSFCLPEHHPGYVSWPAYLQTRERLRANVRPRGEGGGAAREGAALLQGILRCGRCGRRMQVGYAGRVRRYACVRGHLFHATDQTCHSLGGGRLDQGVAGAFPDAVTPAGAGRAASSMTANPSTASSRTLERALEDALKGQHDDRS